MDNNRTTLQGVPLNKSEWKVYSLLLKGGKVSTMDIARKCFTTKGASRIFDMRRKKVPIADEWRTDSKGTRYKVYYLTNPSPFAK